ncbi:MAG: glycosyltransferase family 2 protein [Serratia marcescens]|uniref:glycosyltransferase family A protein n=1 Tax=Serratia marcescens TaxID=615 RepID=UPI0013DA24ED|nr:glycosyltransferase family 2 protein [Serratia marcescens]MDU7804704.1 glycosyltransferase family 2 protein [Serratia marcescens]BEO27260.1 hypothetical protein SMQC21_08400 [Serratia marcescens]
MEHADKSQVFFSIVIPCYNASNSLAITLDSLYEQKFKDFEVVIVDDCSADRDETRKVISKEKYSRLNITFYSFDENKNGAAARNKAVSLSKGRYICFLDADDSWSDNKLDVFFDVVKKYKETDRVLFYSKVLVIADGMSVGVRPERAIYDNESVSEYLFARQGFMQTSSLVISRVNTNVLYFNEIFRRHQDFEYCIKAQALKFKFVMIDEALTNYLTSFEHKQKSKESVSYSIFWLRNMTKYMSKKERECFKAYMLPSRYKMEGRVIAGVFCFLCHLPFTGMKNISHNIKRNIKKIRWASSVFN